MPKWQLGIRNQTAFFRKAQPRIEMEKLSMSKFSAGQLLVASPTVDNSLFGRSVCLVMHHDGDGAIGVMLNRPLQPKPEQLLKMLAGTDNKHSKRSRLPAISVSESKADDSRRVIHFGGPLAGPVVALHNQQKLAEATTGVGVYVAAQKDHLQQLFKADSVGPMRLIVGHAAWKGGQLEAEIAAGLWYLLPATADRVFEADDLMWPQLIRTGVGHSLANWVGIDDTFVNPNLN